MSTQGDLSSLPPATLRAALDAAEERVRREKEKIRREIRKLQKRLDELEEREDTPEMLPKMEPKMEPKRDVVGGSQRKPKRVRSDSPSDDEEVKDRHSRWPIAKARKVDPEPVSPQRCVRSEDETLAITQST
jgi:chromosome segregation ATPase